MGTKIADKIIDRLPGFYRAREKSSSFYQVLSALAKIIGEQEGYLARIKDSHSVDTAQATDLDRLAVTVGIVRKRNESDEELRKRIKLTTMAFQKGGTVETVRRQLAAYLAASMDDFILLENPIVELKFEKKVISGDSWVMTSNSIFDEQPKITISMEEGEAINPTLIDIASNLALKYQGTLKRGEMLEIANGKAFLNRVRDVTSKILIEPYDTKTDVHPLPSELREFFAQLQVGSSITPSLIVDNRASLPSKSEAFRFTSTAQKALDSDMPRLGRKPSKWLYREKISESIARFDESKFDDGVFFKPIPPTIVRYMWNARLLAAFEVKVPEEILDNNEMTKQGLEEIVNSIKAAGVRAFITIDHKEREIIKESQKVSR